MEEPFGKIQRRAETSESLDLCLFVLPKQARPSPPQVSASGAGDAPTEGRLYMSMTEEGPSGEYRMTMKRDHVGRWIPTNGEKTVNVKKAREERRNFYVGESKEQRTFSITSAEASPLHGEFHLSRRNTDEVSWNHLSDEDRTQFSKAIETKWKGVLDLKHASGHD